MRSTGEHLMSEGPGITATLTGATMALAPSRPLRLLFVLPDLSGGGAQRMTLRLLRHFDPTRFAVTLLVLDGPGVLSPLVPEGLRLVHAPRHRLLRLGKLATLFYARGQDVLIAATELRASFCVRFAARVLRKPSVAWVRIAFGEYAAQLSVRNRERARSTYGDFDRLVFVSGGARESFERWTGERREQWRTIHNVFDDCVPARADAPARPLILGIGRLESRKGFDVLIKAAALVRDRGLDFDLAILGEGPLRNALEAQARSENLHDRLQLPGFVDDVSVWLRRACIYVLSSRIEGLPGTILEAFAAGAPVIATRCPHGPEEMLEPGAAGRLVAVDDAQAMAAAMIELLASPSERELLAARGRQRLRDFRPGVILPQWQSLLQELAPAEQAA